MSHAQIKWENIKAKGSSSLKTNSIQTHPDGNLSHHYAKTKKEQD